MVIVMQEGATDAQIQHVIDRLVASGFNVHRSTGESHTVLGAVGVHRDFDHRDFELLEGVREVMRITQPFKFASRQFKPEGTIVDLGRGVKIGGNEVVVAAGPCSVESREQILSIAESVAKAGAKILRAGAFKPRTSPYAFQGMGEQGLKLMREAADKFDLFTVSEVMDAFANPDDARLRRYLSGRRAQHAELLISSALSAKSANPSFSSAACPPPWKSFC